MSDAHDIRILTNVRNLPSPWSSSGRRGSATTVNGPAAFLRRARNCDLIVVFQDARTLQLLALAFLLLPFRRKPIVAVDLLLNRPEGLRQTLRARIQRLLFGRIDHFVHYFRDLSGYQEYFGIGPERSSFVYFKANIRERIGEGSDVQSTSDGQYVLCFGRSQRDYDTFFQAVSSLPYPAAIPTPKLSELRFHGSRFSVDPASVQERVAFLDDDGSEASQVRLLRGARLVVLPIVGDRIRAAGITTYFNAMLVGKCVITSEGPGVSDVLSPGQAILVPPEDPAALARAIERAWEDRELRERTARAGRLFAESLGGERDFYQRILDAAVPVVHGR